MIHLFTKVPSRIKYAVTVAGLMILLGTVFYHYVENFAWVDSFYFSTIVLTTVGLGDFTPVTTIGKIFTSFYALIGISVVLYAVTAFGTYSVESQIYPDVIGKIAKVSARAKNSAKSSKIATEVHELAAKMDEKIKELEKEDLEIERLEKQNHKYHNENYKHEKYQY